MFGPFNAIEATQKKKVIATHFLGTTNIFVSKVPINKLKPGMELIKDSKELKKVKSSAIVNYHDKDRAMRRSIKQAKHIIRCNTFELYATFTFATDRYNFEHCRRRMETWLENQKKRVGHFEYIIVLEFHADGALHFHALLIGYKGKVVPAFSPRTHKQLRKKGRLVFDIPSYTHGHVDVYKCESDQTDRGRLEYYLNKLERYLTKEQHDLPKGKKRFWYTRGLNKPIREDDPAWFDDSITPIWRSGEDQWGETLKFTSEQIEQMRKNAGRENG